MSDDETLRQIAADHQRLVDMTQNAIGLDLERAEELRRNAMRALEPLGGISSLLAAQGAITQIADQLKPMQQFYENAGISRLISESALVARGALPDALASSKWISETVTGVFGQDWHKQLA